MRANSAYHNMEPAHSLLSLDPRPPTPDPMPQRLHGVLPIVQTPFLDSDEIDFATLRREVDWAFGQGIDGLGTGMVSELLKLTAAERQTLAEKLVEMAAGRGPVFMGIGA